MPPQARPVLRLLDQPARSRAEGAGALLERLRSDAPSLAWRQSYAVEDLGPEFMENYAWTELVGPRGLAPSDRLACGILVLGPRTHYPSHRHEAYEVYVPLTGTARWRQGEREWCEHAPGSVLEHASEVPHSMQTADEPLVALYLWRSHDLAQSARLEAR